MFRISSANDVMIYVFVLLFMDTINFQLLNILNCTSTSNWWWWWWLSLTNYWILSYGKPRTFVKETTFDGQINNLRSRWNRNKNCTISIGLVYVQMINIGGQQKKKTIRSLFVIVEMTKDGNRPYDTLPILVICIFFWVDHRPYAVRSNTSKLVFLVCSMDRPQSIRSSLLSHQSRSLPDDDVDYCHTASVTITNSGEGDVPTSMDFWMRHKTKIERSIEMYRRRRRKTDLPLEPGRRDKM